MSANTDAETLCKQIDNKCFNSIILKAKFQPNTAVVWYPVSPLTGQEIHMFYNTQSASSLFNSDDSITFNFVSNSKTIQFKEKMKKGKEGIHYLKIDTKKLTSDGFFTFSVTGKPLDNNAGSPWRLAVVDKYPAYTMQQSTYCDYYYLDDDKETSKNIKDIIADFDKQVFAIEKATGIKFKNRFNYYFYRTKELLQKYHANSGNNYEEYKRVVYSYESHTDMHEVTHLLFSQIGKNVGLISEGIAIHFGQELVASGWQNHNCNWWVKKLNEDKKLPNLKDIVTPQRFYMHDWTSVVGKIHYPVACSFTAFLINKYGLEKLKEIFTSLNVHNQDDINKVDTLFISVYKKNIDELQKEWANSL